MNYIPSILSLVFLWLLVNCQGLDQETTQQLKLSQAALERAKAFHEERQSELNDKIRKEVALYRPSSSPELINNSQMLRSYTGSIYEKMQKIKTSLAEQAALNPDSSLRGTIADFNAFLEQLSRKSALGKWEPFTFNEQDFIQKNPLIVNNLLTIKQIELFDLGSKVLKKLLLKAREEKKVKLKAFANPADVDLTLGETFELDFGLHQVFIPDSMRLTVNGNVMPVKDGVGYIKIKTQEVGPVSTDIKLEFYSNAHFDTVYTRKLGYEVIPK